MADVEVGDELVLSTSRGDVSMTAGADPDEPDRPILGIVSSLPYCPSRISLGFFWDIQLYVALNWTFLVLVNIAVLNMLPIPFFDGDRFLQYFLQRFVERHDQAKMLFNMLSLFLLAANMTLTMSFGFFSV